MAELTRFEDAAKRIDEIAEELSKENSKPNKKMIIELRNLCGSRLTVPTAYQLEGIVKVEPIPRRNSQVSEIWKGAYDGKEVALKVIKISQDASHTEKRRFCKEVVLMKNVNHANIIPFLGVSAPTTSDFCLVFPWYKNGNITDYLKGNSSIDRYTLLLGAVNGLRFLHDTRLVHGALQPSHVLVDDNGNARLATAGRSSIVAARGTSTSRHVQSEFIGNAGNFRYSAPEVGWPEEYGSYKVLITKESDMYGMAMVIYEVLTERKPYYNHNYSNVLPKVQAGEILERPPGKIDDLVWELLKRCWSKAPTQRPPASELYNTLANLIGCPQVTDTARPHLALTPHPKVRHILPPEVAPAPLSHATCNFPAQIACNPQGRSAGELQGSLKLQVRSIKFSLDKSKKRQFYVKLRYESQSHKTALTRSADSSIEHTWNDPEGWVIETNKQYHKQLVSLEVFRRTRSLFKSDKVVASGNFSLLGNVGKPFSVNLSILKGTGSAVLKIQLMQM